MRRFTKIFLITAFALNFIDAKAVNFNKDSLFLEEKISELNKRLKSNPDSVLDVSLILADKYKRSNFFQSSFLNLAANAEIKRANIKKAQKYIEEAIDLRKRGNYPYYLASSYETLNKILHTIGEDEKALEYLLLAKELKEESNNPRYTSVVYHAIGSRYIDLENYDSAYFYYSKAKEDYLDLNDSIGIADSYANLAEVLYYQDYNNEAIEFYKKSYTTFFQMNLFPKATVPLIGIATVFQYLENTDSSIHYYKKALNSATVGGNNRYLDNIYLGLAENYTVKGQSDSVIAMYQNYIAYKDSVFSAEKAAAIAAAEVKFDTNAKEQQLDLEEAKNAKIGLQNENKTKTIYGLVIGIILIAILVFIWLRNLRQKGKLKGLELDVKNQEVDRLLKEQEAKSYAAMLEGQDVERQRIAQDLHDRLGGTLAAAQIHFNAINQKIDDLKTENRTLFEKLKSTLTEAATDVRRISHDLVSGKLADLGLRGALTDLTQTLNQSGKIQMDFFMSKALYELDASQEQEVYSMIQELISNTLKHANATQIDLQLNEQEKLLNIIYEDNGIGFELEKVKNNGLGMQSLQNRINKLNGTIDYDTVIGRGVIIIINLPL